MGLSPYGCERMVAELLLGHQTPCMLPRSISGVLGDSGGLCGPPWVKKWGHGGVWVFGPHTPRIRSRGGGYTGLGTVTCDQKLYSIMRFFVCAVPSTAGQAPTTGLSKRRVIG
jgi:hypothetical protein